MARLSTSTARNATLGIAAAAMLAATSLASPTRADEPGRGAAPKIDGLPAQCLKAGNELAQYKCGSAYYRKMRVDAEARSAEAKARGEAADKKIAEASKSNDEVSKAEKCFDFLKQGIGANKFKREAVLESAGGKVTVENACPTAARYGYERRASATVPEIR